MERDDGRLRHAAVKEEQANKERQQQDGARLAKVGRRELTAGRLRAPRGTVAVLLRGVRDDVDVQFRRERNEPFRQRRPAPRMPSRRAAPAEHHARRAAQARIRRDLVGDVRTVYGLHARAEPLGKMHVVQQPRPVVRAHGLQRGRLHEQRRQRAAKRRRHARARADDLLVGGRGGQAYEDVLPNRIAGPIAARGRRQARRALGAAAQGQRAQRGELSGRQAAGALPGKQRLRLAVHKADARGAVEHGVRDALPFAAARDGGHRVAQALDVAHVGRGVHVDAGAQQFLHVLIALCVAAAPCVGARQIVHDQRLRPPAQRRGKVEPACLLRGDARQPLEQGDDLRPAMRLHRPRRHVHAARAIGARLFEHGAGLARAGRIAEEDVQPAGRGRLPVRAGLLRRALPPLHRPHLAPWRAADAARGFLRIL